jgi:hypothetical protein
MKATDLGRAVPRIVFGHLQESLPEFCDPRASAPSHWHAEGEVERNYSEWEGPYMVIVLGSVECVVV